MRPTYGSRRHFGASTTAVTGITCCVVRGGTQIRHGGNPMLLLPARLARLAFAATLAALAVAPPAHADSHGSVAFTGSVTITNPSGAGSAGFTANLVTGIDSGAVLPTGVAMSFSYTNSCAA